MYSQVNVELLNCALNLYAIQHSVCEVCVCVCVRTHTHTLTHVTHIQSLTYSNSHTLSEVLLDPGLNRAAIH